MQAGPEGLARLVERLVAGQAPFGHRLDHGQEVVGAVLQLFAQKQLTRLGAFALGDVDKGDDDAVDVVLGRAVRPDAHDKRLRPDFERKITLDDGAIALDGFHICQMVL